MIFKCFSCNKRVMFDDVKPLVNRADLSIEECKHCGSKYKVRQYKNGRVTISAIPREESED